MDGQCSASRIWERGCTFALIALLAACGGDGGDSRNFNTLGGTIDLSLVNQPGGSVTGLQLSDGVESFNVALPARTTGSVAFTFPTALSKGTHYSVIVAANPAGFACTPTADASGTMGSTSIDNVTVTCTDSVFSVSGTVQLNLVNPLPSNVELGISDGADIISVQLPAGATTATLPAFSFPTLLKTGARYAISVPANPSDLTCTASKASGTVGSSNVNDVLLTCADSAFELSGQVTMVLQNPYTSNTATVVLNDGPNSLATATVSLGSGLTGTANFTFPNLVAQGAPYTVSIASTPNGTPSGLTCTPSNNTGTIANANVTNIAVTCSDAAYSLGGTATGLQFGGSVVLSDNDESIIVGQGPSSYGYTFPTALAYNSAYSVAIQAQSLVQCSLGNGTGSIPGPVTDLVLNCALPQLALLAGANVGAGGGNPVINPASLTLRVPSGVAVDSSGTVYVANTLSNQINKITRAGVVTTLAGTLSPGNADGIGAAASFNYPGDVALDPEDNVYVADANNNEIRKITPTGVVTTLAGSPASGNADGTGAAASFNGPAALAVDSSGNVYVADSLNNEIRKITPAGVVTTLAGSPASGHTDGPGPTASFNFPQGVAVDATDIVYVADSLNNEIRKITPTGAVTTLAGSTSAGYADGAGAAASFYTPSGLAIDATGTLYVSDTVNSEIRKVSRAGVVTTLAGVAPGKSGAGANVATFNLPLGLTVDAAGSVYVADSGDGEVREVTPAGTVSTLAGSTVGGGYADGLGSAASFNFPQGVTIDGAGNVYLADTSNNEIRKISIAGAVTTFAGSTVSGAADGTGAAAGFNNPEGVAVDAAGNVYVADSFNNEIRRITSAGAVSTLAGSTTSGSADGPGATARFNSPAALAVDAVGNLYVADGLNNEIRKISPAGLVTTLAGSTTAGAQDGAGAAAGFNGPEGVALDAAGNVYVADSGNNEIRKITPAGVVSTLAGSTSAGSADGTGSAASFNSPLALVLDGAGNIYVADSFNYEIRKITPAGTVTTVVGNPANSQFLPGPLPGSLGTPTGIALSTPDSQGNWNMVIATESNVQYSTIAEIVFANGALY